MLGASYDLVHQDQRGPLVPQETVVHDVLNLHQIQLKPTQPFLRRLFRLDLAEHRLEQADLDP